MPLVIRNKDSHLEIAGYDVSDQIDHIPPMVYTLSLGDQGLMLHKDRDRFKAPKRYYGPLEKNRDTIIRTFKERKASTGVGLTGVKGSGKTAMAEALANKMLDHDFPVFKIDREIPPAMIGMTAKLAQPCMVLFDEYEKNYDEDAQEAMLALFSDTDLEKVLFVITGNDNEKFNENLRNRPGRFLFWIEYENIRREVVEELLADYELSPEAKEYFLAYVNEYIHVLNFDVVKNILDLVGVCKTPEELAEKLYLFNVPAPIVRQLLIEEVFDDGLKLRPGDTEIQLEENVVSVIDKRVNGTKDLGFWNIADASVIDTPLNRAGISEQMQKGRSEGMVTVKLTNGLELGVRVAHRPSWKPGMETTIVSETVDFCWGLEKGREIYFQAKKEAENDTELKETLAKMMDECEDTNKFLNAYFTANPGAVGGPMSWSMSFSRAMAGG